MKEVDWIANVFLKPLRISKDYASLCVKTRDHAEQNDVPEAASVFLSATGI